MHDTWAITFAGEADDTFERLLDELRELNVRVTLDSGEEFDARLIDSHTFQRLNDDGDPIGRPFHPEGVERVHVY